MSELKEYFKALYKLGVNIDPEKLDYLTPDMFTTFDGYVLDRFLRRVRDRLEIHACYSNCYKVLQFMQYDDVCNEVFRKVEYVEGYASICGVAIEHAWLKLTLSSGQVKYLDPTITYVLGRPFSEFGEYAEVLTMDYDALVNVLLEKKHYGPFMDINNL